MKTIPIQNSDRVLTVLDEHFDRLSLFIWYDCKTAIMRIEKTCAHVYADGQKKLNHIPVANEVMQDYKSKFDHRDRDICNNLPDNLRTCTNSQNGANKPKRSGQTSSYKGVSYDKARAKWAAHICVNYHRKFLGRFLNEEDAARAYDKAAKLYFSEFAVFNFPDGK